MFKKTVLFTLLILLLIGAGCSASDEPNHAEDDLLTFYTSIYPIQYITEKITGDKAIVKTVYPPGVDAHSYEPTTREIMDIARADGFIYLGAGMESFAETAAESLKSQDVLFIEIGKHTELFNQGDHDDEHNHSQYDPHIWLDPLRMIEISEIIKDELSIINPEFEEVYTKNRTDLKNALTELDREFMSILDDEKHKDILVSHGAYNYWEERYGIKQIPISGLMSGDEPSQKELSKIVKEAKDKNLKYVIFEQNSTDRVAKIIQDHIGADALYIHDLEVLNDEDIKEERDYLSIMRSNLSVLNQATAK